MRISLIDVDSLIPNLALMKISAYHKQKGDVVGFKLSNPDKIYMGIVFTKNNWWSKNKLLINKNIEYGGSGYDLSVKLPDEIEFMKPDYDLYPSEYSMGFTTRGCNRNCYFCFVRKKEGKLTRHQHPKEFHDDRFNTINIMDNNWLMDRDWFFETSNWIIEKNLKVIENGLDIRLINEEIIKQLKKLKTKIFHFAFDFTKLEPVIRDKVELLKEYGISPKDRCDFYVYCDSDDQYDDALYRCNFLRSVRASAFLMFNPESYKTKRIKNLIKWCNRKQLFWKVPFDNYSKLMHT